MEITGKLIQKLPVQSGVSSAGNNWSKAEFVIETIEQYPKKVCANLWGDRARALDQFQEGNLITVSFDLESREFNGRWYTDVKARKVEAATPAAATGAMCNLNRPPIRLNPKGMHRLPNRVIRHLSNLLLSPNRSPT